MNTRIHLPSTLVGLVLAVIVSIVVSATWWLLASAWSP